MVSSWQIRLGWAQGHATDPRCQRCCPTSQQAYAGGGDSPALVQFGEASEAFDESEEAFVAPPGVVDEVGDGLVYLLLRSPAVWVTRSRPWSRPTSELSMET